jgi:ferredoxin
VTPPTTSLTLITDRARCTGHARCHALAPELFELDDRGYTALPAMVVVAAGDEAAARTGAESCPERVFALRRTPPDESRGERHGSG